VLHGPLSTTADRVQGGDASTRPPARVAAVLGAHNPECKQTLTATPTRQQELTSTIVDDSRYSANSGKQRHPEMRPVGAPAGGAPLISSYISRRRLPDGVLPETTEKTNDPREAATSGGPITKAVEA
jgi:hypothetical protein